MLTLTDSHFCRRSRRRDFLSIGSLCGLSLPLLLASRARGANRESAIKEKSVVFLFLQGGPPQIETFDPKVDVPANNRSCTGDVATNLPGLRFGGTFPQLAQRADRLAVVHSFATGDGSHNPMPILTGNDSSGATMGAMCARGTGSLHARNGVPMHTVLVPEAVEPGLELGSPSKTFSLSRIESQVASSGTLGSPYRGFVRDGSPEQMESFRIGIPRSRFDDRFRLLNALDGLRRDLDSTTDFRQVVEVEQQAYNVLLKGVADAFDLSREDPRTIARYDTSHVFDMSDYHRGGKFYRYQGKKPLIDQARWSNLLGKQMLLARRLVEAGCGFVTVVDSCWDFHGNGMNNPGTRVGMRALGSQLDHAVSAFLDDLDERGMAEDVLLVITGEMGRSPVKNDADAGTDHHADLTPLLLAGGGLRMGQVIGRSDRTGSRPATEPYGPENLLATILHTMFDAPRLRVTPELLPAEVANAVLDGQPIPELFSS